MQFLLTFAMGIELLAEVANVGFMHFGRSRKRKGLEASDFNVSWSILQCTSCFECPTNVYSAGKNPQVKRVVECDASQRIIGEDCAI